jgi:predicted XRE-type DNA-binding protein
MKPVPTIGTGVRGIIMTNGLQFKSVWEALEEDPVRVQNLKLRSEILIEITEKIRAIGLTQAKAAEILRINQPRVSALLQGKINKFRLDSLVDMAHRLGLNVSIQVAA